MCFHFVSVSKSNDLVSSTLVQISLIISWRQICFSALLCFISFSIKQEESYNLPGYNGHKSLNLPYHTPNNLYEGDLEQLSYCKCN